MRVKSEVRVHSPSFHRVVSFLQLIYMIHGEKGSFNGNKVRERR